MHTVSAPQTNWYRNEGNPYGSKITRELPDAVADADTGAVAELSRAEVYLLNGNTSAVANCWDDDHMRLEEKPKMEIPLPVIGGEPQLSSQETTLSMRMPGQSAHLTRASWPTC